MPKCCLCSYAATTCACVQTGAFSEPSKNACLAKTVKDDANGYSLWCAPHPHANGSSTGSHVQHSPTRQLLPPKICVCATLANVSAIGPLSTATRAWVQPGGSCRPNARSLVRTCSLNTCACMPPAYARMRPAKHCVSMQNHQCPSIHNHPAQLYCGILYCTAGSRPSVNGLSLRQLRLASLALPRTLTLTPELLHPPSAAIASPSVPSCHRLLTPAGPSPHARPRCPCGWRMPRSAVPCPRSLPPLLAGRTLLCQP